MGFSRPKDTRRHDLEQLRREYPSASPRDKRKIEAAGQKIRSETGAVRSMRASLEREHRAGRVENVKDIHQTVLKNRRFRSDP